MATIINKLHGLAGQAYLKGTVGVLPRGGTGPANYLWRGLILLNRVTSGKTPYIKSPMDMDPALRTPNTEIGRFAHNDIHVRIVTPKLNKKEILQPTTSTIRNEIAIIKPTSEKDGTYESVVIQGMPRELEYNFDSTWAVVKSPGRNNPFYFYTGSEDTISFEISWYSNQEDRKDVITKCRILESWAKSDGYKSAPPILWLSWGESGLFKDDTFVLTEAPYKLSNFQNSYRSDRNSPQINLGLIPTMATQKIVMKRVTTHNLSTEEIQKVK